MLLYVSKVPIVVCLTSAGPKILTEVETLGERCREKPAEDEDAVEEEALVEADKDVVAKGRAGKTVKRAKVVSPALKSGVRNAVTKKVTKSRSPKTRAANKKRVHESAPPSANTSPVLKPPAKKKGTTTRRRAGVVENLID